MITELEYIYFLVALLMGFRLITWVCKVDLFHQLWEAIQKHGCSATAVTAAHASFPVHTLNKEETSIPVRHKRANSQQVENLSKTGYTLLSSLSSFFGAVMKKKHWQFGKTLKGDVIDIYYRSVPLIRKLTYRSSCCSNPTVVRSLKAFWASSVAGDITSSSVWQTETDRRVVRETDSSIHSERHDTTTEKVCDLSDPVQVDTTLSQLPLHNVSVISDELHHWALANR